MLSSYKAVGIFEEWEVSMELFNATIKSPVRSWDAHLFLNQGFGLAGLGCTFQGPPTVAASGPRKQPRLYGFIGNKLNTTLTKTITH